MTAWLVALAVMGSLAPAGLARENRPGCQPDLRQLLDLPHLKVSQAELNAGTPLRALGEIQSLKVATYNVLNLIEHKGRYITDAQGRRVFQAGTTKKPDEQLDGVVEMIEEMDADVLVINEVDSMEHLAEVARTRLGDRWHAMLLDGNDSRGINIGFLVKRDLPFELELISYKNERWTNPLNGEEGLLFSRDNPVLLVRSGGSEDPILAVSGVHNKSQRDGNGDPRSVTRRRAQVERQAEILTGLQQRLGENTPIIHLGDFNADVRTSPEFAALRESGMADAFDLLPRPPPPMERVTQSYHPRGGQTQYSQLDAAFLSRAHAELIEEVRAFRYKDAQGVEKPLPRTYDERETNPSDHFPLRLVLNFRRLLQRQGR